MGPRFCKRGNEEPEDTKARRNLASMGPRFCKRGNTDQLPATYRPTLLQWGHAFVSVETKAAYRAAMRHIQALQWGHAFVSVETALSASV